MRASAEDAARQAATAQTAATSQTSVMMRRMRGRGRITSRKRGSRALLKGL